MSAAKRIATVAVDGAAFYFDRGYSYLVPDELAPQVRRGARVTVPFGRGGRVRSALVLSCEDRDACDCTGYKTIATVYDSELCDSPELLDLIDYLKESTFCTWYDAAKAILPAGAGVHIREYLQLTAPDTAPRSETEARVLDCLAAQGGRAELRALCRQLELEPGDRAIAELLRRGALLKTAENRRRYVSDQATSIAATAGYSGKLTAKQQQLYQLLAPCGNTGLPLRAALYQTGVTRSVADRLVRAGAARYFEQYDYKEVFTVESGGEQPVQLTCAQQQIAADIRGRMDSGSWGCDLLYGVTGSGKTVVFVDLIRHALEQGRQAMLLVPEISLTPQVITRFKKLFGQRVAVIHSALSVGQRLSEYRRIRQKEADIVIGTRSAVFAPLENIGLIVLDEEQESSYHSDSAPRYHARDVACWRARRHGAQVVLASATPSIDTYYRAKKGEIALYQLPARYAGAQLPQVQMVDMRAEMAAGAVEELSRPLRRELQKNMQAGKQSILLLNRRGYHTSATCPTCGAVAKCPHCDIPLTYHRANGRLMCHYCGYSAPMATCCDNCGEPHLRLLGAGTQKLEDELEKALPGARILRMDTDTTASKNAHRTFLEAFSRGEYDVLVGTQMVAKGLDFPGVTLVGVLGIDNLLAGTSYQSYERCFSLVTQVVGRGGRGADAGRAILQTFDPQNRVLQLAAKQDYDTFATEELQARRYLLYPPYCHMAMFSLSATQRESCLQAGRALMEILGQLATGEYAGLPLRLMGPTPFLVERVGDRYRYKIIAKCRKDARTRQLFRTAILQLAEQKKLFGVRLAVDFWPQGEI